MIEIKVPSDSPGLTSLVDNYVKYVEDNGWIKFETYIWENHGIDVVSWMPLYPGKMLFYCQAEEDATLLMMIL